MANLRVNKITGTEVFETTGSVQFDGSGDVLTVPNTADFRLGSGDFTLECFMYYVGSLSSNRTLFGLFENSSARRSYQLEVRSTGVLRFEWWADGSTSNAIDSPVSSISSSQWAHIAVVRNGSVITIYINGSSVTTSVVGTSSFFDNTVDSFRVGALNAAVDQSFSGHISNVRVLKGTALYTKNFTPPIRELTVIPNTVLLCCQSTTRANEEKTGKTITVVGNATASELSPGLLTDRVKSGGSSAISGSVEFDGTGDYLVPTGSDFGLSSSEDFTLEMWIYATSFNNSSTYSEVIRQGTSNASTDGMYITALSAGTMEWRLSGTTKTSTNKMTAGSWNHIAVCRNSGTVYISVNGLTENFGSVTNSSTTSAFRIGADFEGNNFFKGHLSNVRFVKGIALYTSNFIPPTRELKKLPGTVLLCCQDSTNPLQEATGKTIYLNGSGTSYSVGIGTTTPNPRNFTPSVGFDGTVVFDGVTKINTPNYFYLPTGNTEDRGRGRGLFGGGYTSSIDNYNGISFVNIQSSGISQDFGDLTTLTKSRGTSACSSSTRGIWGGGYGASPLTGNTNIMNYVTIATTGNATEFGSLTIQKERRAGCSNSIRGLFGGGATDPSSSTNTVNVIDYITIASTGNGTDFGDLLQKKRGRLAACSSPTRGLWAGGYGEGGAGNQTLNIIEYVTITSTGNAIDFGDLTQPRQWLSGTSSSIRGVFAGGYSSPLAPAGNTNTIDYITIASTGDATDFGDLITKHQGLAACSDSVRGLFAGGYTPSPAGRSNTIHIITITSSGNATDFGDLNVGAAILAGCSDSHGGLG